MSPYVRTLTLVALLAAVGFLIYAPRLRDAPMYLGPDEVIIAVDAHSIASTAHDVEDQFLPLYFNIQMPGETRRGWFMPMIFYWSALFYTVLPFSEFAVRLPSVCIGVIDVVLMFLVAKKLFESAPLAIFASASLALAPAHFILSRIGQDYIYPVPFVLAWLLGLVSFVKSERPLALFMGTLLLGIGFYSYIAAVVLMPLYLLFTFVTLFEHNRPSRLYGVAAAGFCLPLLLLIPWLLAHPAAVADTIDRYALYDSKNLNILQGARSFLSYTRIDELTSLYWSFFNPSFLFLSGDQQTSFSTRSAGVFLLPVAVLLPLGMYHVLVSRRTPVNFVVLLGFVTAPLVVLFVAEGAAINRAVEMLPFGVLLATFGVQHLWSLQMFRRPRLVLLPLGVAALAVGVLYALWTVVTQSRLTSSTLALIALGIVVLTGGLVSERVKPGAIAALCLLALMPLQFGRFYSDYFDGYRLRAAPWFGGNLRGALERMIELDRQHHVPLIYFSRLQASEGTSDIRNRWMDAYWKFYLIKHGRQDLLDRTARFDSLDLKSVPPRSLVLANIGDLNTEALVKSGELQTVEAIPEVDREAYFAILRK